MTIVFVYNAEEGIFNAFVDGVHKFISPRSYECRLCAVTHGSFRMLRSWRRYLDGLAHPVVFFHRAAFQEKYDRCDIPLPAVLVERDGKLEILLSASEIRLLGDTQELMHQLDRALIQRTE